MICKFERTSCRQISVDYLVLRKNSFLYLVSRRIVTKFRQNSGSQSFEEVPLTNSRCDQNFEESIKQKCSNENKVCENASIQLLGEVDFSINEGSILSTVVTEQIASQDSLIALWNMSTHLDDVNSVFAKSNIKDHMSNSVSLDLPEAIAVDMHPTALQSNIIRKK